MARGSVTVTVRLGELKEFKLLMYQLTELVKKLRDEGNPLADDLERALMRWARSQPTKDLPDERGQG